MFVQAVKEFLDKVRSREHPHSAGLVSQPTAIKFLMARKFDVSRAIDLFQDYKVEQCFIKNKPGGAPPSLFHRHFKQYPKFRTISRYFFSTL